MVHFEDEDDNKENTDFLCDAQVLTRSCTLFADRASLFNGDGDVFFVELDRDYISSKTFYGIYQWLKKSPEKENETILFKDPNRFLRLLKAAQYLGCQQLEVRITFDNGDTGCFFSSQPKKFLIDFQSVQTI